MNYLQKLQASAKRKDKIRAMHKKGMTPGEIATAFGLTRQRVDQILKEKVAK